MYTAKQVMNNAIEAGLIDFWANDYVEPGYSLDGKVGILFANWNPKGFKKNAPKNERVMSRLANVAIRAGFKVEWSDEWSTCGDCGGAIRTQPDCWYWKPSYRISDGGSAYCHKCELERCNA